MPEAKGIAVNRDYGFFVRKLASLSPLVLRLNKTWTRKPPIVNTARPMSPALSARKCLALLGLSVLLPGLVMGQTNQLVGGDVSVAEGLAGDQVFPSVALAAGGGFAAWQDNSTDPSGFGIRAQRLSASGAPHGEPFQVNQSMGDDQQKAKVAMLQNGGGIVVFQSGRSGKQNVLARLLNPDGSFAGNEFVVNSAFTGSTNRYRTNVTLMRNSRPRKAALAVREVVQCRQEFSAAPVVSVLNDGSIVVAYSSSRTYSTNSTTLKTEIPWIKDRFITNITAVPYSHTAATLQDVYFQRFSATGEKLGSEVRVNQFSSFNQRDAAIASLANGNFIIVWISEHQRPDLEFAVYGRIFDAQGQPVGAEFPVNPLPKPSEEVARLAAMNRACGSPAVASLGSEGFSVVWSQRTGNRTNGTDVFVRAYSSAAVEGTEPALVNQFQYGDQHSPALASVGNQQLITWASMGQDGSWNGIYARAFDGSSLLGEEFRVNQATRFDQKQPQIAASGGRALLIWSGFTVNGAFDLFGRFYVVP